MDFYLYTQFAGERHSRRAKRLLSSARKCNNAMAFIPAPNQVQVEMRALLDNQHIENRIFVNAFHEPTISDLNLIAGAVSNAIITDFLPLLPTSLRYTELFLRSMQEQNAVQASYPFPGTSGQGTNVAPALPSNCTICASLRSNFSGRSARGRLYWPALMETVVVQNTVDATHATNILTALILLNQNLTVSGVDWQIVSFRSNGVVRPGGPVYFSVESILFVDNIVDSQRRRLPGRGN